MKICQDIDKVIPSQFVLLNTMELKKIASVIRKKFQMERFWNVFGSVTKVSKENGLHGNLLTKQNEKKDCFSRISLHTFNG